MLQNISATSSLFEDGMMRKCIKSIMRNKHLYKVESMNNVTAKMCVVDGDELLHKGKVVT